MHLNTIWDIHLCRAPRPTPYRSASGRTETLFPAGLRVDVLLLTTILFGPRSPDASAHLPRPYSGAIAFEELGLDGQRRVGPTATPLRGVWDVVGRRLRTVDSTSAFRRTFVTDRSGRDVDVGSHKALLSIPLCEV